MWGYQRHFQIGALSYAQDLFNKIDNQLKPKVFLIGVLNEEKQNFHPICLEPEDCGYDISSFDSLDLLAQEYHEKDDERNMVHTDPGVQASHKYKRIIKSKKNAIIDIITHNSSDEIVSFISWPAEIEGYLVFAILQLNSTAYNNHYSLKIKKVKERFSIETSLLNGVINEFLNLCTEELNKKLPGSDFFSERKKEEIIRAAGESLMYTPAWAGKNVHGLHGLFEHCNIISSLKYEKEESYGKMIMGAKNHPNIDLILEFSNPIYIDNYRGIRKVLEIARDDLSLLCDSVSVYGLGKIKDIYDSSKENLFQIHFIKHYTWNLYHDENLLMHVEYGVPKINKKPINEEKLKLDMKRIFSSITDEKINNILEIVSESSKQKHGTSLVINTEAESEAIRLSNQSTLIRPTQLTPSIMKNVSAIDGAVLIDPNGICYSIGVILDGLSTPKGDSSRGARYNSAIRYVASSSMPCLIIVVSEDGMINAIPDLMPQLKKIDIIDAIEALEQISIEPNINYKNYHSLMDWFQDKEFYLDQKMCDKINELRKIIYNKDDSSIKIIYQDLVPNSEMNDTYFIE